MTLCGRMARRDCAGQRGEAVSAWQELRFAEAEILEPTEIELATACLCLLLPCSNGKMVTQCSVKEKSSLAKLNVGKPLPSS